MAKVKSSLLDSIRGSIGDVTYAVWKGIMIARKKAPVISQPQSKQQQEVRNLVTVINSVWATLSVANQFTWAEMAERIKDYPQPPGGIENLIPPLGGPQSGFNCFLGFYSAIFLASGVGTPNVAPVSENRPAAPTDIAPVYDNILHSLTVTWTDPVAVEPLAFIRLWLVSRRDRIYHKQFVTAVILGVQTITIDRAKAAKGASITMWDIEPSRIGLQMDTVNPSGFRSLPSAFTEVDIA